MLLRAQDRARMNLEPKTEKKVFYVTHQDTEKANSGTSAGRKTRGGRHTTQGLKVNTHRDRNVDFEIFTKCRENPSGPSAKDHHSNLT